MKKIFLSVALLVSAGTFITTQQSCVGDVTSSLFPEFVSEYIEVPFEIPVVTNPNTGFVKLDTTEVAINFDAMIKSQTGGAFGLDKVNDMRLEEMHLMIENPDADNNWANFTGVATYISSDANNNEILAGTRDQIPDTYATDVVIDVDQDLKLKSYLSGNKIYYSLFGGNRRATTKAIKGTAYIKYRIK